MRGGRMRVVVLSALLWGVAVAEGRPDLEGAAHFPWRVPIDLKWAEEHRGKGPFSEGIWLERFSGEGGADLKARGWHGGSDLDGKDHFLVSEASERFARSHYIKGKEAKYIYRERSWELTEYPFLRWRWRVRQFPQGAHVNDPRVSDAAAQVYILCRIGRRSYAIKYFWAPTDPVGTVLRQSNWIFGKLFGEVIRSGGPAGEWHVETRNVLGDFKTAFERDPPEPVRGFGILSDGDETNTDASADFDDFEAIRTADHLVH